MSVESPQKPTTLREYIRFLRDNNFNKEADHYENEVCAVLKQANILNPLSLTTREVVATLYGIIDAAEEAKAQRSNAWEVELVG